LALKNIAKKNLANVLESSDFWQYLAPSGNPAQYFQIARVANFRTSFVFYSCVAMGGERSTPGGTFMGAALWAMP